MALVQAMLDVQARERTGALHVESEGAHAYVYFRNGVAVSAEEGTLGETLGRILLDQGILSTGQYNTIIERMTAPSSARGSRPSCAHTSIATRR